MRAEILLVEDLDGFNRLLIEVDKPDRIPPGQAGIVIVLEALERRPVGGGFGDDGLVEFPDGLEKFEDALEAAGVSGGQWLVDGDIVGFDDHTPVADGVADRLPVNLQGAEGDVRAVVAVEQRHPAGRFEGSGVNGRLAKPGKAGGAHRG